MSSQISNILETIGQTAVDGITAVPMAQTPDSFDSWRFPCRVLLPISGRGASGELQRVATFSGGGTRALVVDWAVSDLFLLRAADAGIGLADALPALTNYMAEYMTTMAQQRHERWSVTNISFPTIGPIEWPSGGRTYDAVQCQLTIREII